MRTTSAKETKAIAKEWVNGLSSQQSRATIVVLQGDLGAGKTTWTQGVAEALGITEPVISPTFVLMKEYQVTNHAWIQKLVHIDAYRFEDEQEGVVFDWEQLIQEPESIIFVEWPERITDILPKVHHQITFTYIDEDTREITVDSQ